ncbi:hypothetical protein FNW52_20260 [Flavobacterium sp. ZT3R18]|uniref:hypothetical protein n=1 Tax=Flavobacterium sp. ZT3R18 TaxID=2594429 RepID=UPI00117AAE85|nr:hypothetical protein [Flavobacterium sp. ZT3R18]TRX30425.1 hypothetical protein FNW52_20260 [Flavobacterium sp. ZT3R18]
MKKLFLFCFISCFFFSCQQKEKPTISFYYWKTIFRLSPKEKNTLSSNQVKRLYIRYFDIDLNPKTQKPYPKSPVRFEETAPNFEIIPVVYIKNKVMLDTKLNVLDLAKKTNSFIQQINAKNNIVIQEIQIDCDWTLNSKDNYLRFIEAFKKVSNKKLSATIRLHQIKYFKKTKIPNVDRGVLMYYNMGKIAPDSLNSIYDRHIANRYLSSLKNYPLPIDIALPIYSWGIHIRDGKIIGLRNKIDVNNLKNNSSFVLTKENWFTVTSSTFKNGVFYKEKDLLKIETISRNDLLEMADDLEENTIQNPKEIIFYDLDEFNIKNYDTAFFKKIIDCF